MLPHLNCIVYPNGTITLLEFNVFYDSDTNISHAEILPICDTTIESIMKYDDAPWVCIDEWCIIDTEIGRFSCGDGAFGNDGFVAHTDCGGKLVWALFFNKTNPIKDLKINGDFLIGQSEHDDARIEINLKQLTDIKFIYYNKGKNSNIKQI